MGLSLITVMAIASHDDLIYSHAGPSEDGKYSGWITLPGGRPLLNTEAVFDTAEDAKQHVIDLRAECVSYLDEKGKE